MGKPVSNGGLFLWHSMTNLIFLCSRNRLRSPTGEQVFAAWPGVETSHRSFSRKERRVFVTYG
jgi:hypothetical protein